MLDDILDNFDLGRPISVKQIKTGHINQTFQLVNSDGFFALQSLHPFFPDETLTDMHTVTDYLSNNGLRAPKLLLTKRGEHFAVDHNNLRWRLYSWIDGQVFEKVENTHMAYQAGLIVCKIHKHLVNCNYQPQAKLKNYHNTPVILKKLGQMSTQMPPEAKRLATRILKEAPSYFLPDNLDTQVIHGDLKISNIVFDDDYQAIGIIDFDTLMAKPRTIDLGDAMRSWCNKFAEDSIDSSFDRNFFLAAEQGYRTSFNPLLDEAKIHLQAAKLIAYELSARFLIDMVTDNYFSFDETRYPSRRAHNFARAIAQYYLANSIEV